MSKTALITGGSGGIGSAIVREFSRDYDVSYTYLSNCNPNLPGKGYRFDAAGDEPVPVKSCDLLILAHGISWYGLFDDMTESELNRLMNVNLIGTMNVIRQIKASDTIIIGSLWGELPAACEAAYSASKAGLIAFADALAKEGRRTFCLNPGWVDTAMTARFSEADKRDFALRYGEHNITTPERIALWCREFL